MFLLTLFSISPSFGFLFGSIWDILEIRKAQKLSDNFNNIMHGNEDEMYDEDDSDFVSVAIVDDKAYWIFENTFYEAEIIDGEIDRESSKPVNVFELSNQDVNRMLYIIDNLNEG